MFDIGKYLEKFKNFSESHIFLRKIVAESIKETCLFDIEPNKIKIKESTVFIKDKPIIKTQIFIKKEKILNLIKQKTNKNIIDII